MKTDIFIYPSPKGRTSPKKSFTKIWRCQNYHLPLWNICPTSVWFERNTEACGTSFWNSSLKNLITPAGTTSAW